MENMTLDELHNTVLYGEPDAAARAVEEIKARIEKGKKVAKKLKKMGFKYDAEGTLSTVHAQERFLEYAASLGK